MNAYINSPVNHAKEASMSIRPTVPNMQLTGRPRRRSHAATPNLGGREVPREDLTPKKTDTELDLIYGLATKQAIQLLGGDGVYMKWMSSKQNPLEDVMVGFDVLKTEQCKDVLRENCYPTAGIFLCTELLPNASDSVILREEYFKRWDKLRAEINERLNGDALIKCSAAVCIKKVNKRVAKFARATFDRIHAIKYMTKDSLMKSKRAGAFTGTKILRVSLVVGWINDLADVVFEAVYEFEEWLNGARAMYKQVSHENPRALVERMALMIDNFEPVHDIVGSSSDSEKVENDSESEDGDESDSEEEADAAKPANAESVETIEPAAAETTEPAAAETAEPAAANN